MIQRRTKTWRHWAGLGFWGVGGLVALSLLTSGIAMTGMMPLGTYIFLFSILLLAVWSETARIVRRRRAMDVLGYIEQAVILNVPIPVTLMAAEQSETGVIVWRLGILRKLIDAGEPLGQALMDSTPEIPLAMARQVSAAERLGQLPQVLRWLRRPRLRALSSLPEQKAFMTTYLPGMLLAVAGVVGLIGIVIIPQYRKILHDFKVPLPWTTGLFVRAMQSNWILWVIAIYVLIRMGRIISEIFESEDRYFGVMVDVVRWHVPVLHGRIRDEGLGALCRVVGAAAASGWPLETALREGADMQSNAVPRGRILRWATGMESGMSIQEAARAAKMPRLMVGMLAPARSSDDLAQVMLFLARHYESRVEKAEILFEAAYIPAVVAVMGVVVGFIAVGLLMPLITLVNALAMHMPGSVR